MTSGSRLAIVTVAGPAVFSWLVTTAPNDALSPTARKRGNAAFERHRLVDADLGVGRSEARARVAGDRHDAVGRQRLGQLDVDRRVAASRRWRPSRARTRARGSPARTVPGPRSSPPPPPSASPFGVRHAPGDDPLPRVLGQDLQRLVDVDRLEHVRRAIAGQRQHAVVDGPQRHLARGAAPLTVLHVDGHRRGVRRPVLFLVRGDATVSRFARPRRASWT